MTMNGFVTLNYLQWRFWTATLVLLVTLVSAAATVVIVLREQANRTSYVIAFHRLGSAVGNLQKDFAHLSNVTIATEQSRAHARATYIELFTEFRAAVVGAHQHGDASGGGTSLALTHDHLEALDAEFGVDAAAAAAERKLKPGAMCEVLTRIWEGEPAEPGANVEIGLEAGIAQLLRSSAPIIRGEGSLTSAEIQQLREIELNILSRLESTLRRVSQVPENALNRAGERAVFYVLLLSALGIAATLLNLIWIFRPLERTVIARQAEIIAERDKAIEADVAKRNFLSVVSHELRTPMNGVLGFASLLLASDLKPAHRKQVEIIQSSGKSLLALVNDILDFSKLEAGILELEDENFSIEEAVSDVVNLLRGSAAAKQLEMSVFIDARLPATSRGDGNRLRQILTNLVGNAVKFTDSGGIGIEARAVSVDGGGCEVQLGVSDTGIGIPADKTATIFERFTQIGSSARRRGEGCGLGLAICKQLAEQMGGRIWVESAPGAGSTFFVRLPFAAPIPDVRDTGGERSGARAGKSAGIPGSRSAGCGGWCAGLPAELLGCRVLIVDGNPISRRLTRLQLESCGFRVDDASNAAEGLKLLDRAAEAQDPHAVAILDQMLPDIGGGEVARRIRENPRHSAMCLMLHVSDLAADSVSSTGVESGDKAGASALGVDAVEQRPVLPRTLIGTVTDLLSRAPEITAPKNDPTSRDRPACGHPAPPQSRPDRLPNEDLPLHQRPRPGLAPDALRTRSAARAAF